MRRLDRLLSNYRPESEWSRGQSAGGRTAGEGLEGNASIFLSACVRYSEASEGAFDITVGPLMEVWGF